MAAALVVVSLCPSGARALEVSAVNVAREGGAYRLAVEMDLRTDIRDAYRRLTRYEQWDALSSSILSSRVVASLPGGRHRVHSVTRACVFIFCTDLEHLQDITVRGGRLVVAETVADGSDFREGRVEWRLRQSGEGTRLSVRASLVPDFWIPPLIGPWMVESALEREMVAVGRGIERGSR